MTKPAMAGPFVAVLLVAAGLVVSEARAEPRALQAMPAEAEAEELSRARAIQTGPASWYGPGFHGRPTASGEPFNTNQLTAAHRTLPFGTRVKVVHQKTRRSVVVRINDRGPYAQGRVIDLSWASAQAIGLSGVAQVALLKM
jgi:rare lipoprotein A